MGERESLAGQVLASKYLLIERLGEGGFGSIWRAEHQVLKSPVAVKLIDLEMARKDGAVERFLREAQATARLRSPHVVQVLDYGVDGDQPFIVMELLDGENLAERLERTGTLQPIEVVRIVTHVARAIGKAHELGIVHRDLKPENIFLVNNGDEEIAKVLDFGVAKIASPPEFNRDTYTRTGSLIGTPYYMSPEQAQGNKAVDYRSDLWALGVITFEMLTGKRPFESEALGDLVLTICVRSIAVPSAVAPVPKGFNTWFARAMEREPDARFQSAREMALALLQVVESDGTDVHNITIEERLSQGASTSEAEIRVDLPARPSASAFAATVRDDALAVAVLSGPAESPSGNLPDDRSIESEENLAPWAVIGIAVLALVAGAAAVYGAFFLIRDHDVSNEPLTELASESVRRTPAPTARGVTKHRFDVNALNKPATVSEPANGRARRPSTSPPSTRSAQAGAAAGVHSAKPNPPLSSAAPAVTASATPAEPAPTPTEKPHTDLAPEVAAAPLPAPLPAPPPASSAEAQQVPLPLLPPSATPSDEPESGPSLTDRSAPQNLD